MTGSPGDTACSQSVVDLCAPRASAFTKELICSDPITEWLHPSPVAVDNAVRPAELIVSISGVKLILPRVPLSPTFVSFLFLVLTLFLFFSRVEVQMLRTPRLGKPIVSFLTCWPAYLGMYELILIHFGNRSPNMPPSLI